MGRRPWRLLPVTAFLLFLRRDTSCQNENDFYYTPVERSFAQVQPPLFPSHRPVAYFNNDNPFRVSSPEVNTHQQQSYSDGHSGFPSPNYNQHPSPFQLPTGRSQPTGQFYLNQPDFNSQQRQRFRTNLPHNYQLAHSTSTRRPDTSQIHSIAYQNDPSKPETFLGQITINNPDTDFLQNNRFRSTHFEGNSLRTINQHNHDITNEDDGDDRNQDLFDNQKVTTYNPNRYINKQKLIENLNSGRFHYYEPPPIDEQIGNDSSFVYSDAKINSKVTFNKSLPRSNGVKTSTSSKLNQEINTRLPTSTENKALLDLEPLLEEDINDMSSFRELMKNTEASYDVQVIKAGANDRPSNHEFEKYDSNPSASSMNTGNISKETPLALNNSSSWQRSNKSIIDNHTSEITEIVNHDPSDSNESDGNLEYKDNDFNTSPHSPLEKEDETNEEDSEYEEYYDDIETTEIPHVTRFKPSNEASEDNFEDYESIEETTTEEIENLSEGLKHNSSYSFDVVTMKTNNTMVLDDNFKQFVDTTAIDQTENPISNIDDNITAYTITDGETPTTDTAAILGQEIVSVVTTKSVVNGTISIPNVSVSPSTTALRISTEPTIPTSTTHLQKITPLSTSLPNTTENWVVVASVQTSRSVSGARFLPFPNVEQEEKKQVLLDSDTISDENEETVTKNPKDEKNINSDLSSTENINDKLDSIQSDLSSAVLSGKLDSNNKNIALLTEPPLNIDTTPSSLNVFTLKSTQQSIVTEKSVPDPLPVLIKRFTPRVVTTTQKPTRKPLVTVKVDDLTGLLPPGYKPRHSYKDKKLNVTTTTPSTTSPASSSDSVEEDNINGTQGRSSGISSKNKVVILDETSPLVSKNYNSVKDIMKQAENLFKSVTQDDLSKFLPPGYKITTSTESILVKNNKELIDKIAKVDVSAFLPKDYKPPTSTITASTSSGNVEEKLLISAVPVNISALLPAGYKLNSSNEKENTTIINKFDLVDVSNLLPPGYNTTESTTKSPSTGFKVVFPSRAGNKPIRKTVTPKPNIGLGPSPATPKIQKGWPVRASTEFTGWPSPSTTPFSIEKLLEAQRNATATSPLPEFKTERPTRRTTTTTTTTTSPAPSTTPGVCHQDCDIAATIKIVAGVKWLPELLDHHTEEWQNLAKDIKAELNSVYSKSHYLKKWYKSVRIEGFSKGSVLVDYFIELNDVKEKVDTMDLKKLFHNSLQQAQPGSVVETIEEDLDESFDPDVMLGDQPEEDMMKKSNEQMKKTIDKSAGKLEMGKFVMDPAYTEFIVLPKREEPTVAMTEEESLLPQWGIAVIVIALASLLFVVIFGVTVLVNRQNSAKAKQPIPLSEDMLRELDKSHMGGFDDVHQLKERELPYVPSGKRLSTAFIEQLAYPNPGDSWRSEWTPQMQKYMQHYTPDSGRGSQIYGAGGNVYGYSGSQLYGQTGGGSQNYGYTGEYPRSHYSRRRSDYDSNF